MVRKKTNMRINISRKGKLLLTTIAIALMATTAVAQVLTYVSTTTSSFTVGTYFQVAPASVSLIYDWGTVGTMAACTAGTFPAWTCPSPTIASGKLFAKDNLTLVARVMTEKGAVTPSATATTTNGYAIATSFGYRTCDVEACNSPGPFTNGMPTMAAGTWYAIYIIATLSGAPTPGTLTFSYQLQA